MGLQNGDFNADFGAAYTEEQLKPFLESGNLGPVPEVAAQCGTDPAGYMTEAPVLSAFALDGGDVYQTYSTTARGLEPLLGFYGLLDRAPRAATKATLRCCGFAATTSTSRPRARRSAAPPAGEAAIRR